MKGCGQGSRAMRDFIRERELVGLKDWKDNESLTQLLPLRKAIYSTAHS